MTSDANIYTDFDSLTRLRAAVRTDNTSAKNLRAVASQFEALFTQMVLKNMREASLAEGLFDSDQEQQYLDMFDSQMALHLSQGRGLGLTDMLVKQLSQTVGVAPANATTAKPAPEPLTLPSKTSASESRPNSPQTFAASLWPHAEQAAKSIGVAPQALIAQAALETGWGKSIIHHADGRSSHNIFGIKATPGWTGERVSVPTVEYEDGVAVKKTAEFRAYASMADSFADYTRLVSTNPRYREALSTANNGASMAMALQRGGYASDPDYAAKIKAILNGGTLATALSALKISGDGPLTG